MKPKPQPRDAFELFQSHFDQLLDPSHELILLANKIDWSSLDAAFADYYHHARTHLSLDRNSPVARNVESPDRRRVIAIPQVGGLHHRYRRAA